MILPPNALDRNIVRWLTARPQFRSLGDGDYLCLCCRVVLPIHASLFRHKIMHCVELGLDQDDAERLARQA